MNRRVVVTGIGVISCVGIGKDDFWRNVVFGNSGIRRITRFDPSHLLVQIAGEARGFHPQEFMSKKLAKRTDLFMQFGIAATRLAIVDSLIDLNRIDLERASTYIGTAVAGGEYLETQHILYLKHGPRRVSPLLSTIFYSDAISEQISIEFGLKVGCATIAGACAASATSIALACDQIRQGKLDVIFAGGAETPIIGLFLAALSNARAMSRRNDEPKRASRPFDLNRDGFVLSEGACVLVLEELEHARARDARIYAEIAGVGMTSDAYSMTAPAPDAEQATRAMLMAMKEARTDHVDYINAHGSSTQLNDYVETQAIKNVFGKKTPIPISSTKSVYGHSMGAAGAMDLAVCCLAMQEGTLPPTINLETKDPACDLNYVPNKAWPCEINWALSNSFGFGGYNTGIVLRRTVS